MTDRDSSNLLTGVAVGGLVPIAVAGALVPLRDHMAGTNVALIFVVVVVVAASIGGWIAGATAAAMSALSFDFFHVPPYLSLSISTRDDVETTILLLVVGVLVGVLASWGRRQHDAVGTKRDDILRIHRVAEQVAASSDGQTVIDAAAAELTDMLQLESCHFEPKPYSSTLVRLDRSGAFDPRPRQLQYTHGGFELPADGVGIPVLSRGHEVGRLVLQPTPGVGVPVERRLAAVLLADQIGAALAPIPR